VAADRATTTDELRIKYDAAIAADRVDAAIGMAGMTYTAKYHAALAAA